MNVVIDRFSLKEPITKGRSYCDHCKKTLRWLDMIPIFSFLALGGKSRCCHAPLSWQYPLVELLTGVLFALTFFFVLHHINAYYDGLNIQYYVASIKYTISLLYYLFVISSFIVIFFIDLKHETIPDKVIFPAIAISFVYLIFNTIYVIPSLLSAVGAFFFFFVIFLLTKGNAMGFGDVKLSFLLGLFLGFPKIIIALYLAFLTGAITSTILVVWGKKKFKGGTVPFGPFLILGAFISFFFGDLLLQKTMQFLLFH